MSYIVRRVQLTGKSTFIVSLPKKWASEMGLKPGSQIMFRIGPDGSLLISPSNVIKETPISTITVSTDSNEDMVFREYLAHYLAGSTVIKIIFITSSSLRSIIKNLIRNKLIGIEIVEETSKDITTQVLTNHLQLPLLKAINRMHLISLFMYKDALESLKTQNIELAKDIIERDDEVDRFYHFIVRQLNMTALNISTVKDIGLNKLMEGLEYRIIAKSIERIGDHSARIAKSITRILKWPTTNSLNLLEDFGNKTASIYERVIRALNRMDKKLAQELINDAGFITDYEQEITNKLLENNTIPTSTMIELKLIMESIRRVAEYSEDIAESVINLSISGAEGI
ncbi:MAG: PhoU domain-containing protein [Thermoprotei archaeon]